MVTRVINIRAEKCTVYIGRTQDQFHYGNPFSTKPSKIAALKVNSRDEAIMAFHEWLSGKKYQEIEPERRAWILDNIEKLRGQEIGCFCKPLSCHGDIYRVFLGELTLDDVVKPSVKPQGSMQMDMF